MINKILKGWLNINKLVKIFIYDWHNCTSTAHVAQRGIFAHPCFIHCHRFSHFSLRFASSSTFSIPRISAIQESKNGGQTRVEQSAPSRLQSNPVASSPTQPQGARQPSEPPLLRAGKGAKRRSCPFLPSSRLSTCPAQLFGTFRVCLIQRS